MNTPPGRSLRSRPGGDPEVQVSTPPGRSPRSRSGGDPEEQTVRFGTRGSALARTQCGHVADAFRAATGREVELVEVRTDGDRSTAPLATMGGAGVFVGALRDALLRGDVDVAVHSLKDLPTAPAADIELAADPRARTRATHLWHATG